MSKKSKKRNNHQDQGPDATQFTYSHAPKLGDGLETFHGLQWMCMSEDSRADWVEYNVHDADDFIAAHQVFAAEDQTDFNDWVASNLLGIFHPPFEGRALSALASSLELYIDTIQLNSVDPALLKRGLNKLIADGLLSARKAKGNRIVVFSVMPCDWKLDYKYLHKAMKVIRNWSEYGDVTAFRLV